MNTINISMNIEHKPTTVKTKGARGISWNTDRGALFGGRFALYKNPTPACVSFL